MLNVCTATAFNYVSRAIERTRKEANETADQIRTLEVARLDRMLAVLTPQQTDRLSETLDSKRGSLVETIGGKSNQLIVDIERVTSEALKAIESRGLNFSQSIATNGSTVARSIT